MSPVLASRLTGRAILVTGAASGIGLAVAELFAAEGATLALLDANREALLSVSARLGCHSVVADISDRKAARAAVEKMAGALGGLDGVVNSAGIVAIASIDETDDALWDRVIGINLTGTYHICRAVVPWLQQGRDSTIVNVSSNQGLIPSAGLSAYAASKGGILAFTKALAAELGPDIRVNSICPGTVDTPMHTAAATSVARSSPDKPGADRFALKRIATAREIAQGVLYLTGPESTYVTGITLAVDGGRTYH